MGSASMFPAARKTDTVNHDGATTSGTINPPSSPCTGGVVMIDGRPAAHINCTVSCTGVTSSGLAHPPPASPPPIVIGSSSVLVHGQPASRWIPSGDQAVCCAQLGDAAQAASRSVLIGGPPVTVLPAPTTDEETLMQAMFRIRNSAFAQTPEGQVVVAQLNTMYNDGDLYYHSMGASTTGSWNNDRQDIRVNEARNRDVEATASTLVHEGTHGVDYGEHGVSRSIDEEVRTNNNQLDFYEEQRGRGYRNAEQERRRTARNDGTLRDDVRSRYPSNPEHR